MNAIARARDDVAAGHVWMARDRLAGRLCNVCDTETLTLLAEIHLAMQDLPAAGAMLFVLGQSDATEAIAAWEAKYPDVGERWLSLPRTIRVEDNEYVRTLRNAAGRERPLTRAPQKHWTSRPPTRMEAVSGIIGMLIHVSFFAYGIIGFATILHWIWGFPL